MLRFVTVLTAFALLSACAYPVGPRESTGTLLGAGAGAVIGSQFGGGTGRVVGAAIGTLAGALIGQDIGRTLDRADRQYMQSTTQQTLETAPIGKTSTWVNPDTGNSGAVTPTSTYKNQDGRYCREYQQTVTVAGKQQQAYGTACRQPDGTWQIVDNSQPAAPVVQQRTTTIYAPPPAYDSYYYRPYAYYPSYWPFFTSLSFSFSDHDGWGHRRHHGHWEHRGWHH